MMHMRLGAAAITLLLSGCGDHSPATESGGAEMIISPQQAAPHVQALPAAPRLPPPAQVALGRLLFWDPVLSVQQDIACGSCHHPDFDYSDGLFASRGTGAIGLSSGRHGGRITARNSPTVVNTVFNGLTAQGAVAQSQAPMFWDSRRRSLEQQAEQPLLSAVEMRGETVAEDAVMPLLLTRLNGNAEYRQLFALAFATAITEPISEQQLLAAIANFERSLISNNSPFDRFMRGDSNALSAGQQRGLKGFIEVGCAACHSGPMFSDFQLHVLGTPDHPQNPNGVDTGAEQRFAFRTPSLRNLANTAPYAHSGTRESLSDMLDFYVGLSRSVSHNSQVSRAALDPKATALDRVDSVEDDIIAFLEALNDPAFDRAIPVSVPSGLAVGGAIDPS